MYANKKIKIIRSAYGSNGRSSAYQIYSLIIIKPSKDLHSPSSTLCSPVSGGPSTLQIRRPFCLLWDVLHHANCFLIPPLVPRVAVLLSFSLKGISTTPCLVNWPFFCSACSPLYIPIHSRGFVVQGAEEGPLQSYSSPQRECFNLLETDDYLNNNTTTIQKLRMGARTLGWSDVKCVVFINTQRAQESLSSEHSTGLHSSSPSLVHLCCHLLSHVPLARWVPLSSSDINDWVNEVLL